MRIRKLQLKNIGPFANEEIEFQPCPAKDKAEIHLFTGPNGSGKTTLLMALAAIFDLDEQRFYDNGLNTFCLSLVRNELFKRLPEGTQEHSRLSFALAANEPEPLAVFDFKAQLTQYRELTFVGRTFSRNQLDPTERELLSYSNSVKLERRLEHQLPFAVFAFSGNRQMKSEAVEAIFEPKNFNPLFQSLDFAKAYDHPKQLTVNQLIANNFSKKWIESSRNPPQSARFAAVLKAIEQAIYAITGWQIEFDLQTTPINLVTKLNGQELEIDALPDGLRSLISWLADLLSRVDLLKWADDAPITEKKLILFLDEIEVHLHPAWQRKVLPVVQKLFKNSQIFVSTHSPFVVNSVDDAWVYKLTLDAKGQAKVAETIKSEDGFSYSHVLSEIFDIDQEFGGQAQKDLDRFYALVRNGKKLDEKELLALAKKLAVQTEELNTIVQIELRQLSRRKGKEFSL